MKRRKFIVALAALFLFLAVLPLFAPPPVIPFRPGGGSGAAVSNAVVALTVANLYTNATPYYAEVKASVSANGTGFIRAGVSNASAVLYYNYDEWNGSAAAFTNNMVFTVPPSNHFKITGSGGTTVANGAMQITYYSTNSSSSSGSSSATSSVRIQRKNGSVDYSYTAITNALNAASAGDTVIVGAGTYWENDLLRKGVNLFCEPGAVIMWRDSTTNTLGRGIIDDRTSGATTNTIVLRDIYFSSCTNLYVFGTPVQNSNLFGAVVITNPATLINLTIENSFVSTYGVPGTLYSHLYIQDCKTNSVFRYKNMLPWTTNVTMFDDDFGVDISVPANEQGLTWIDGEFYLYVDGTIEPDGYYGIWGELGGTSAAATNAVSNAYVECGFLKRKVYIDCSSSNYRLWLKAFEIDPGTKSYGNEPLTFFGSGKHYVEAQKIGGNSGGGQIITLSGGLANTNVQVWVRAMKIDPNGAPKYADVPGGDLYIETQHWDEAAENGMTRSGNGKIIPSYTTAGQTNISASASSLVVRLLSPMPTTNYSVNLSHSFNPVAIPSITAKTPTNFTISYSAGVTTGGSVNYQATLNAQ